MIPLIYINGTVEYRDGQFYARPFTGPPGSVINEYGPFDMLEDAEKALEDAP